MTEAKRKANNNYNAKLDNFRFRPRKEVGMEIRAAARAAGESIHSYILSAVLQRMKAEGRS